MNYSMCVLLLGVATLSGCSESGSNSAGGAVAGRSP